MNKLKFLGLLLTLPVFAWGQSSFAPLNEDYYHLVDRYEVKAGQLMPQLFTGAKPYKRSDIAEMVDSLQTLGIFDSKADQFNRDYLLNDNWEWSRAETSDSKKPFWKHFYRKKSDLYHVDVPDFDLHINPVLYLGAGKDSRLDDVMFINTRGLELRGMVDRKVGFYTYLADNQMVMPSYVQDQMTLNPVVPHEGFWKDFKDGRGVDFLQARGYITLEATKHINMQFGYDRYFIGNGVRSLIYSDYAPPSLFLKTQVKVWKFNYLFYINRMTADVEGSMNGIRPRKENYPSKYVAFHQLSMNIGRKLNIGLFESVVFEQDSTNGFKWEYLNPIIFYRAIEQQNGSSDNVMLGLDFKWNAAKKLSFYGQFVLDEFVLDEIKAGDGWWANKYAIQVGGKYIDAFGVSNLDLQGEYNVVRPFTFAHNTAYGNYSSYQQPIGHPLGANFNELIGVVRYQPIPKLSVKAKLILINIGRDSTDYNWGDEQTTFKYNYGSDVLKGNNQRKPNNEYGNEIGQGFSNNIVYGSITASWQVMHNLFVDANLVIRKSESPLPLYNTNTTVSSLTLRWNIAQRLYEF